MSRGLSGGTISAAAAALARPAVFLFASFIDGDVRLWTGQGTINWAGYTWLGLGTSSGECLGTVSPMVEDSNLQAQGINLTLSGVDPAMLTHALGNIRQGLPCRIWVNFFDDSMNVIGSALTWAGRVDQPTITEGADACTISLSVESRLSDLQRAQCHRWTDQDQRQRYPSDDGFSFVNTLQLWAAVWGKG